MAQKIVTVYVDDLTGEESTEVATHTFSLDGVTYQVDLGPDSYDVMLEAFGPFIKAARRTGRSKGGSSRQQRGGATADAAAARKWAVENGYEVSNRGRVPAAIYEAYRKASPGAH
ncbi:Lsr2 family protein [Streptomyces sp. NPDC051133]|uniref:histone-like nucleoid-structuring protein Lsr2 n=1 Tax=Streptomyces sp. NPDC051133 TaxID=3155521 RepID=UPI00341F9378